MADRVPDHVAVAVSPTATSLVAERAEVLELPTAPADFDDERLENLSQTVEWLLLDTTPQDPISLEPRWRPDDVTHVLDLFEDHEFDIESAAGAGTTIVSQYRLLPNDGGK